MNRYHLPKHDLTLTQKNANYMCIKLYDSLPENLQLSHTFELYETRIKKLLIDLIH